MESPRPFLATIRRRKQRPYSFNEITEGLGCHKQTLRRRLNEGTLVRASVASRETHVTFKSLEAWLEAEIKKAAQ